ncbi:DUF3780 domain-containing protein [Desulfobacter latus]|uniref:DUF3780 domain-containing protein n=2 Tax=Desulfobacter latus TaxID=2292 RepID=A0A850TAH9_9BACT|nr:DUF3780 domain-containing protein [Desulfobacter latus]
MMAEIDFGAPDQFGMHHFYVAVPPGARDAIRIFEDYGFDGDETLQETTICRVTLARELWTQIRDDARRDFNTRLKSKKRSTGAWKVGNVQLDRFLGRELCVLAWAAELASPDQCAVICQKWLALRPEERWWLYSKTASEAGLEDQAGRGWRKALYCALSDGTNVRVAPKKKPRRKKKSAETFEPSLFDFTENGDI